MALEMKEQKMPTYMGDTFAPPKVTLMRYISLFLGIAIYLL